MPKGFQNLQIWQLSIELATDIYKLITQFPSDEKYALTSQIKRAVNSISTNIAESTGRYHYKDQLQFLYHARGSLEEVKSLVFLADTLFELDQAKIEQLHQKTTMISIKLHNYISSIRKLANKQ